MKAVVVGYGAMGKIVCSMLGDELVSPCAIECECKKLDEIKKDFDVIIDFSSPANFDMIYDYVSKTKTPVVLATTGYTEEQNERVKELAKTAPVLKSANFSLGVILLNRLVKEATKVLKDGYDIEIVEAHHNKKKDAPSGTAKMLLKSVLDETGYEAKEGRSGICPRQANEVGVHAIRGGTIVGEHEVLFCGEDEVITLKHSASSKKIFASGAIKAARWLENRQPGLYDMEDVLFEDNK